MTTDHLDSFKCDSNLQVDGKTYHYKSLSTASKNGLNAFDKLPRSMKVLAENLLRYEDGNIVKKEDLLAMNEWVKTKKSDHEIAFHPARVLMQDFTGVPAVVDLAAMRKAMETLGGQPKRINPLSAVDLVIDHSVSVDSYGQKKSFEENVEIEFQRNNERYEFLRWAQKAFDNFRVVPPGTGICHQVNLEYLANVVWQQKAGEKTWIFPDTLVGTDSHTTMINGLSVLGWGVGGIEAEAAMLQQPVSMLIPEVVGFKLHGKLKEGTTATDLVLTVVEMLRKKGVVGKFVEFYGDGVLNLTLADRATIANMAPEYGATCGFFPIDQETINYLEFTGRDPHQVQLVKAYAQAQGLWFAKGDPDPVFTDVLELDITTVEPSLAGPKRPQDRILLSKASSSFDDVLSGGFEISDKKKEATVKGEPWKLHHGSVVIAAITSCTNTSNPAVMIAAGLVAKKAREKGLTVPAWVKTSLAPGSQVVTDYLAAAKLNEDLDALGFNLVGYGCTTCIGNSGPLEPHISEAIHKEGLVVTSVLSGNRNFEGRISPDVRANYLASPPLVVAYALAGTMTLDITRDPIGTGKDGKAVLLKDIWPSNAEVQSVLLKSLTPKMFRDRYADVFKGPKEWQNIKVREGFLFDWDDTSTYVKHPPYFDGMTKAPAKLVDIVNARALAIFGDSITTDHISPAGSIKADSPAGRYLKEHGIDKADFNSYGSRRGNHEVMMRGTFANIRIRNEMTPEIEGGFTKYLPTGKTEDIYTAAMQYKKDKTPLVIFAGKEYGTGSSRDWAAKGTILLGVRAVITESFERIHRSNLVGMGVLPLQFVGGATRKTLNLKGDEQFSLRGIEQLKPKCKVTLEIIRADGKKENVELACRIDTDDELEYYRNGGILQYVIRKLL